MRIKPLIKLAAKCTLHFLLQIIGALVVGIGLSVFILAYQWDFLGSIFGENFSGNNLLKALGIIFYSIILPIGLFSLGYRNAIKAAVSILLTSKKRACIENLVGLVIEKTEGISEVILKIRELTKEIDELISTLKDLPRPFNRIFGTFVEKIRFKENFIKATERISSKVDSNQILQSDIENPTGLLSDELEKLISIDLIKPSHTLPMILVIGGLIIAFV